MSYYTEFELGSFGFRRLGKNVRISRKSSIYDASNISIGDYSRIDDFCIVSGNVDIGRFCHITPMCLIAGGVPGIRFSDFCTLAYGVKVFAQSDDYSGETMVNSLVHKEFKREILMPVILERQVIVGAGSIVMPGVRVGEGCSFGAMALVLQSTVPWGIYVGSPARRIKERSRNLLNLEADFIRKVYGDSI